jgi:hypothetical protein
MASNRYRAVVAMLDDPLTRMAVTRELLRRGKKKMLPPPVVVLDKEGEKIGWTFPTARQVMREGYPDAYSQEALQFLDREVDVFTDGERWFITLVSDGEAELGPFDTSSDARDEARNWLEEQGHEILSEVPWDADDLAAFPVKI